MGADQLLVKTGTIPTLQHTPNWQVIAFSMSPIIRVAVKAKLRGEAAGQVRPRGARSPEELGERIARGTTEQHPETGPQVLEECDACLLIRKPDSGHLEPRGVSEEWDMLGPCGCASIHSALHVKARPARNGLAAVVGER